MASTVRFLCELARHMFWNEALEMVLLDIEFFKEGWVILENTGRCIRQLKLPIPVELRIGCFSCRRLLSI